MHLGITQMQRSGRFLPAAAAEAIGALLGLLASAVAAFVAHDYRAVLWGLGVQAAAAVLLSQLFARGIPYRFSADRRLMRDALRFGVPLLLNGLALAAAFQLDRIVIGAWLGVVELGIYGLWMALFLQPVSLLLRLANTALQPRLSEAWHADRPGSFQVLAWKTGRYLAAFGAAGAAVAACAGAPLLYRMFGPGYAASDIFLVLLAGGGIFMRLCRGALNLLGLAIGRTTDLMISNIVGAAALPITVAAFYVYPHVESAAFAGLLGEVLTCVVAMLLLRKHCGQAAVTVLRSFAIAGLIPAAVGLAVLVADPSLWVRAFGALAGVGAAILFLLLTRRPPGSRRLTVSER
jgi:O-antigen/teichoic acid export membrane protein